MDRKIECNLQKLNNTIMEKELNIAEILKDKPQGTKLYDLLYNIDVELDTISTTDTEIVVWCTNETDNNTTCHRGYSEFGSVRGCSDGLQILLPSKSMRDWRKFDWKKGDVLVDTGFDNINCIFDAYISEDYTKFRARYCYRLSPCSNDIWFSNPTQIFSTKEFMKDPCPSLFIKKIEEHYKGKLNLETLEIEKQPEFKDGDILYITDRIESCNYILIYKNQEGRYIYRYATMLEDNFVIMSEGGFLSDNGGLSKRYATEEEKQQLFEALAEKGKAWDAEKKAIVDLKPKCELKPFDRCIWKIRNCEGSIWQASFVSYVDEYGATPMGMSIDEDLVNLIILPYNDQTKLLVGTTDEWEGGEQ